MLRFVLLYVAIYAGWGVLSPFLPAVLAARGISAEQIGLLLSASIGVRLVATPLGGAMADRSGTPRLALAGLLVAAAVLGAGYQLAPADFVVLLLVGLAHHAVTGPIGPLPDALALSAAGLGRKTSEPGYAVVRGAGAAAFVAGSVLAGQMVAAIRLPSTSWLNAALFTLAAGACFLLPASLDRVKGSPYAASWRTGLRSLMAIPAFRMLLLVAGLIAGSHSFYTGFATLSWQAAGLSPGLIGLLWAASVGSEAAVFFLLGRRLLVRLGPGRVLALAAAAGVLRWAIIALTVRPPALLFAQSLHGLIFAAQHLAAMAILVWLLPDPLVAIGQSVYASLGTGLASAAVTLASGLLYAQLGAGGFWIMAGLCAAAIPLARAAIHRWLTERCS